MKEKLIKLFYKVFSIDGLESLSGVVIINVSNSLYDEIKSVYPEGLKDRFINISFDYKGVKYNVMFMNNDFIKEGTIGINMTNEKELKIIDL